MAARDDKTNVLPQTILLTAATMLALVSALAALARQASSFGPRVGDIVAFDPGPADGFDTDGRIVAYRPGLSNCVLDLSRLRQTGGSLVLEQKTPTRFFVAHWAGPGTSEAVTDCGTEANLVVSAEDVTVLATAGHYGVHRGMAVQAP